MERVKVAAASVLNYISISIRTSYEQRETHLDTGGAAKKTSMADMVVELSESEAKTKLWKLGVVKTDILLAIRKLSSAFWNYS